MKRTTSSIALLLLAATAVGLDLDAAPLAQDGGTPAVERAGQDDAGTKPALPVVQAPGVLPPATSEATKVAWRAMLEAVVTRATADASTGTGNGTGNGAAPTQRAGVTDRFDVNLTLLTRSGRRGAQPQPETHEFDTRVLYMEPFYVRYRLPEGVETGFGGDGPWLRDGDEIVQLRGREYETDKDQVTQVISLCKNFLSVSTPSQMRLAELTKLDRMPFQRDELPPRAGLDYRRLTWLRALTPDFQLVEAIQPRVPGEKGTKPKALYRVYFGLDPQDHLPRVLHVVRVDANPRAMIFEQLILLESWRASRDEDGRSILLPHRLYVHERLPSHPHFRAFLEQPDREVYVRDGSTLFPNLTEADFEPTVAVTPDAGR